MRKTNETPGENYIIENLIDFGFVAEDDYEDAVSLVSQLLDEVYGEQRADREFIG